MIDKILSNPKAFETILQTIVDAVITTDSKGLILFANQATTTLFGYDQDELLGQSIQILMPSFYATRHDSYMDNYKKTKRAKVVGIGRKVKGKRKDGSLFPCWLTLSEFQNEGNLYFTGVLKDYSDLENTERDLKQINEHLEQLVKNKTRDLENALRKANQLSTLKSKFLTLASHEFKTPLSTILSSTILIEKYGLKEGSLSSAQEKHILKVKNSVQLLTGILEDFINIEKIEQDRIDVNPTTFHVNRLVNEALNVVDNQLKMGQAIKVEIGEECPPLYTDYHLSLYIIINLLSNAIKYSNDNIVLQCNNRGDDICICVIDNGRGIPKENQQNIFERFYRADNVNGVNGTGIGLSLAKRYAQLLQGDIEFESKYGEGSHFSFIVKKIYTNE